MKIADTRLWSGKPSRREGLPLSPPSTPLLSLIRPFSSGKKAPLIRRKGPFHPPAAALLSRRSARATPYPTARARKKGAHPCSLRYCKDITKMPEMQTLRIFFTLPHSSGTCRPHSSPRIFHPEREHSLYPVAALTVKAHGPAAELHSYDAHLISQPGTAVGGIAPARTALLGAQVLP